MRGRATLTIRGSGGLTSRRIGGVVSPPPGTSKTTTSFGRSPAAASREA